MDALVISLQFIHQVTDFEGEQRDIYRGAFQLCISRSLVISARTFPSYRARHILQAFTQALPRVPIVAKDTKPLCATIHCQMHFTKPGGLAYSADPARSGCRLGTAAKGLFCNCQCLRPGCDFRWVGDQQHKFPVSVGAQSE